MRTLARNLWVFLVLAFIACAMGLILIAAAPQLGQLVNLASSHAEARHGSIAVEIRACLDNNGALQIWVNPDTGRRANVCQLGPEKFGIQIVERADGFWKEITAFTKDKMTRIDQVMQYLTNSGYHIIH